MRKPSSLVLVALLLGFLCEAAAQQAAPPQGQVSESLDAYVSRVMTTFEVPGVSLAVVKDGKVVVAKGYGVRRLGDSTPVDSQTLFGIASNTKVFTAVALGLLVDEGKIRWDAPVITYLPWFRMSDPYVTRELTVRDLLVHRSGLGLGAGDLLWWPPSTYTRREIAQRLKDVPLATSFRSAYAYDNVLYLIAGELIETISGQSWEDFVTTRILKKVGMSSSTPRQSDALKSKNVAATHAPVNGKVVVVKPLDSDNTNPAGGISSNAEDMAKWMSVLLSGGQLADGSRLFSEQVYRDLTALVTPMPLPSNTTPELAPIRPNFRGYGLGLNVVDLRGRKTLMHTGGLPGYVSKVLWIPAAGLGVTVLTNQEAGGAFEAIVYRVVDQYLGLPPTDWAAAFRKLADAQEASFAATEKKAVSARAESPRPPRPISAYACVFNDAWYGEIVVERVKNRLAMTFTKTPSLVGDLEHWQDDTWIVRWHDRELRADAYVTYAFNPDGTIDQVKMRAVSPATDFSFDFHDLLLKPKE